MVWLGGGGSDTFLNISFAQLKGKEENRMVEVGHTPVVRLSKGGEIEMPHRRDWQEILIKSEALVARRIR